MTGWETLVVFDAAFKLKFDGLAEEITPNKKGTVWTIRVRDGIEFHNGKTLGADDVSYSLQRPDQQEARPLRRRGAGLARPEADEADGQAHRALTLKQPDGTILDALGQYVAGIVPVGYSPTAVGKANPNIGTGPYKLQSFTPGQQSVHVRNPNYWRCGPALLRRGRDHRLPRRHRPRERAPGGQIDAMTDVPPAQVAVVNGHSGTKVLESPSAAWTPICMRVDAPPFNDVRVRQAMRLIATGRRWSRRRCRARQDRQRPLRAVRPGVPEVAAAAPPGHRARRSRCSRRPGRRASTVDLQSTNGALGMNEARAGVRAAGEGGRGHGQRKILDSGALLQRPVPEVAVLDRLLGLAHYLSRSPPASLPSSPYNETHWPRDKKFIALYNQAVVTTDRSKQAAIIQEMQKMEYDYGRLHRLGLQHAARRLLDQGAGAKQGDKGVLPLERASGMATGRSGSSDPQRERRRPCDAPVRARASPGARRDAASASRTAFRPRRITGFIIRRILLGVLTLFFVSIIVFAATQALPGDAARAILGRARRPTRSRRCASSSDLEQPVLQQYCDWLERLPPRRPRQLARRAAAGQRGPRQAAPELPRSLVLLAAVISDPALDRARRLQRRSPRPAVRPRLGLSARPCGPARVRDRDRARRPPRHDRLHSAAGGLAHPARTTARGRTRRSWSSRR